MYAYVLLWAGWPEFDSWLGLEAYYSPSSSAEVKNGGATHPFPHMSSFTFHTYVLVM
jgi:hypothetical protein